MGKINENINSLVEEVQVKEALMELYNYYFQKTNDKEEREKIAQTFQFLLRLN